MKICTVVLLVLVAAQPAFGDLAAGPERPIASMRYAGAFGSTRVTDVTTDGFDYLALWSDATPGRQGIYASVVTDGGSVRRGTTQPLLPGDGFARAVWTGDGYLVLASPWRGQTVFALRVDRDGRLVAAFTPVGIGLPATLAWNGRRAAALVLTATGAASVVLLDGAGRVVRSDIPLPAGARSTVIAAAGDAFIVAWIEELEAQRAGVAPLSIARAMRVTSDGEAGTAIQLLEPTRAYATLDAASGRREAGVAIRTSDVANRAELRRYIIDGATLAVRADPVLALEQYAGSPRVVSTPGGFIAVYAASERRLGIVPFGASTLRSIDVGTGNAEGAQLASNGRSVFAAWGFLPIKGALFDAAMTQRTSPTLVVAIAPVRQTTPSIGTAGDVALYAWIEPSSFSGGTLLARRFDGTGKPLDIEPLQLTTDASIHSTPAIVFTGSVWIVAWHAPEAVDAHVYLRRISRDGALLDAQPIDLGEGTQPAIASNGKVAALVFTNRRGAGVSLVRLSRGGEQVDAAPLPVTTEQRVAEPAIASNGAEFLVTWSTDQWRLSARRLDPSAAPVETFPVATPNGFQANAARVASNGADFVVAYHQYNPPLRANPPIGDPPPTVFHVYAKRVLRTGGLADHTAEQSGFLLGEGAHPAITHDGRRYVITFVDYDESGGEFDPARLTLFAVPAGVRGNAQAAPRVIVRAESSSPRHALAFVGDALWSAYARIAPEAEYVQRVFLRTILEEPPSRRRTARH